MLRKEIRWTRAQLHTIDFAIRKSRGEVIERKYGSDKGKLVPTDIGTIVTDFLVKNRKYFDYNFTAKVEQDFDEIVEGILVWSKNDAGILRSISTNVKDVEANAERESGRESGDRS
jgi:DNA topoisomerase-1